MIDPKILKTLAHLVTITELRQNASHVLTLTQDGPVGVQRNNEVVAVIHPVVRVTK